MVRLKDFYGSPVSIQSESFNSLMVRLKANPSIFDVIRAVSFNSLMVRLKVYELPISSLNTDVSIP